ncbi:MAG TPA: glucoamylase family protein [Anaerolineales bacterium]|jgi:cyclic beta-1,2-glucan synthetase
MEIAPQVIPTGTASPETNGRQREFAHRLAKMHGTGSVTIPAQGIMEIPALRKADLLERLQSWDLTLRKAYATFKSVPSKNLPISRAGEWMLDNFYIVKQTFRQIEEDLPGSFLNELPKLNGTPLNGSTRPVSPFSRPFSRAPGLPRIFVLAREWIGYTQAQVDMTQAIAFVRDYQQVTPLTIGELWAVPTMLRIGILERLVYATAGLTGIRAPKSLSPVLSEDHGTRADPIEPGLPRPVQEPGPPREVPGQFSSRAQENETIVANCFLSLRLLSATDWKSFFERTSLVDQILRNDPAGIYAVMDFDTRDDYRSVIEELARHSNFSEEQVALAAVELARSADDQAPKRNAHIGYYLLDAGRATLENSVHYRPGINIRLRRGLLAFPTTTYLGSIASFSVLFTIALLAYATLSGGSLAQLIIVAVLGFGLALEAAIILVQWIVTHRLKPQSLPRMDFSRGIPPGNRTMVVVPTLLESVGELNHLLQELELYYLSNPDPQLTYALLTDFGDAPKENMPEDEQLLTLAAAGIENLNKKYIHGVVPPPHNNSGTLPAREASPFYLFHRRRQWNPSEGVWMGWERKRGKLADFNHLLLNLEDNFYTTQIGDLSILRSGSGAGSGEATPAPASDDPVGAEPVIKYVITLDADTSLPQGSANRLVATFAHPLNQAQFSADGRSVVAGYTVLQPRVSIKPTSANRSLFSQIFAGSAGFDLYSFAVSDVYQDLFGEGSYVGKGIYDVAAFERSLAGQVRQNTLLSHDLFEGIYGRAALVTDIVLYEEYPWRYLVYARRLSRWIRGDWQLLPWLFPLVLTENGLVPNRLSTINLWKVFDNLRRSLLPPTLLALLAAGWLFLPGSPLVWTLLVLLPSTLPLLEQTVQAGWPDHGWKTLKKMIEPLRVPFTRWALAIIFLPYESLLILDAIRTTLARLLVGRKHLLQWTTAANLERSLGSNLRYETWREMAASLVLTLLLAAAVAIFNPVALWVALPLLVAWLVAPQIAYVISQPVTHKTSPLSEAQHKQILRLARRTWAFFEQFAGPNDHWLPPDHFQESPLGSVAHYTTPTNIGVYLVSSLAAFDLGYLGLFELAVRLRSTFDTLDELEHYRGHLLNWYDSLTLTPLAPRYVSTVDSGNLAACLITLRQGLLALTDAPVLGDKQWQGLLVILDILSETLQTLEKNNPHALIESFEIELSEIYERVHAIQDQPAAWGLTLEWLSREGWARVSLRLMELLKSHPNIQPETLTEVQHYLGLLQHHLQDMQRSLDMFAPWLSQPNTPPAICIEAPGWQAFHDSLPAELPSLGQAVDVYDRVRTALNHFTTQLQAEAALAWSQKLDADLLSARMAITPLLVEFNELAELANHVVTGMDFRFLFNERRQLFHIGYTLGAEHLDSSYYDLLASEARIASLIAIAKGDVPQSHWQHLGRPVTKVNGKQVLLSWSGTMFEYLMPVLFTRNYLGTFLSDSCYAALNAQISYGQERQVPWGISESGFYAFDLNQNYQYKAFGVPDLGYKRDLRDDLVIAPYASLLGLSLQPGLVLENVAHLEGLDMLGRFGFYEALDYTESRMPTGQAHAVVQSYMAHHQGMVLLAACNYLADDIMVQRFHADEHIQSVELLLQEKIPQNSPIEYPHPDEQPDSLPEIRSVTSAPWRVPVDTLIPQVHLLSQGDTSLLITNAGGGYSQWRDFALTRWQADTTLDQWGSWIYVQDRESGALWSATCQPVGCSPELGVNQVPGMEQEVLFYPHKVEFLRSDYGITLRTGVTVSTDGVEIRRVNILNESDRPRRLKLTSYAEVVLAAQAVDRRHPAFNKLFIESEYLPEHNALLFERRPRSADEKPVVLLHAMLIEFGRKVTGDHESDRARFLGRSQTTRSPSLLGLAPKLLPGAGAGSQALGINDQQLPGTPTGSLDPVMSLGQEIDLRPSGKTRVTFLTLAAPSRAEALEKLSHYQSGLAIYRAFEEAHTHGELELLELGLTANAVESIQQLLSALLYPVGTLRAAPHILAQNEKGQSGLWAFGISGDHPILLVQVHHGESNLLSEALQAFIYWRNHHVTVNLVILNEQDTGYSLELHNTIQRQITRMGADNWLNQRDGIFLLRTDQLQPADLVLLQTVSGVILDEKSGSLAEHAQRLAAQPTRLPEFTPTLSPPADPENTPPLQLPADLRVENGLGGFSPDGREYVIHLQAGPGYGTGGSGQHTPQPWVNIIANPEFGFLVSEAGSGCTWAVNSGENRLTPWRNDPVTDMPGEALYLRDEETGLVWSPTPMPAGAATTHVIRHGAGYSIFESQSHGLYQNLCLFAAPAAPLKIARLRLRNLWERPRRITVTYYAEWVLGTTRDTQQVHIMPEYDPANNALLASNRYNSEFGERVAFLAANKKPHNLTTDRAEFLGRLGSLSAPAALGRIGLTSAVNAGLDPCAVIQLHVDLAPGADEEVFFLLGQAANRAESLELIGQVQAEGQVEAIWQAVQQQWDQVLGTITVETPDPAMDLMLNRWLLYQTLSCRLWGRTALYQSSGAFGFRDQLQDVLALLHARPDLARSQILEAARHQFEAGDVLHWWNPPLGRGVRTRFSDDLLWLPFVTAGYVTATGDASILSENIPFLKGEPLKPGEMERYAQYEATGAPFSLYEHCRRSLEKGTTTGAHGLPLMGSGDWNDGMNRVGMAGRGESIWLAWFLIATLKRFGQLAALMSDDPAPFLQQAEQYAQALEAGAWDGEWYLRAFYDDGSLLGSHENSECRIDAIAQSWAVLSGASDPARAAQAMESVNRLLVKQAGQLVLLFTPPFDKTERDPGYIKGYLPGIRENGGQYTHAATWTAWAFAQLGQGERAAELFRMLNPVSHADTPEKVATYKVEPYVIAADIYNAPAHTGLGGWTWYTGSSGWMYRLGIEAILGLSRVGNSLQIAPCIPPTWPGFKCTYRFGSAHYAITVENPNRVSQGIRQLLLDGNLLSGGQIPLLDDGRSHLVSVVMGG